MNTKEFVYWQEDDMWLGYIKEYPDIHGGGMALLTSDAVVSNCVFADNHGFSRLKTHRTFKNM